MSSRKIPYKRPFKPCSMSECPRPRMARGLCSTHYWRWQRHGDPHILLPKWSLWDHTAITADDTRCWIFQGTVVQSSGYGRGRYNNHQVLAHRLAFFLTHNRWPSKCILHSCDNRLCVNPKHLREGTHKDNAKDAVERGRQVRGHRVCGSKLTEADVRFIRYSHWPVMDLARHFNICRSTVRRVKKGLIWGWLDNWQELLGA